MALRGAAVEEHQLKIGQGAEQLRQTRAMGLGIGPAAGLQIERRTIGVTAVMQHRQIIAITADQREQPIDRGALLHFQIDEPAVLLAAQGVADRIAFLLQTVQKAALIVRECGQNDRLARHHCHTTARKAANPAGQLK